MIEIESWDEGGATERMETERTEGGSGRDRECQKRSVSRGES